jgi:glycosyltransferase involved in cell wall biosynthesis
MVRAPRTILMTADTVGGVFSYSVDLARALSAEGARVVVASMGGRLSPRQRAFAAGLEIVESDYRLEWMDDAWDDVARAGRWLLDLESRLSPDVVHLSGYSHASAGFRAPSVVVGHSCVLSWWEAVFGPDSAPPPRYDRYRVEVRAGLSAASAVVAPTRAMRDALGRHYPTSPRAHVIPNGVDPRRCRVERKEPFVIAVGRLWDQAKNLAALGLVAPSLPWPVRVAGSDLHPDGSARPVPGLEPLGSISPEEVAAWLARAAIFAHPARYEPFGLSAVEAGLSGCALVLGDIPSLREVWGDDAAVYVDPDDPGELGQSLSRLIEDRCLREELGARARDRALAYTPARAARRYLDIYARVVARGGADSLGEPCA